MATLAADGRAEGFVAPAALDDATLRAAGRLRVRPIDPPVP